MSDEQSKAATVEFAEQMITEALENHTRRIWREASLVAAAGAKRMEEDNRTDVTGIDACRVMAEMFLDIAESRFEVGVEDETCH